MIRDRADILLRLIEAGTKAGYKGNDLHRYAGETFRWMDEFLENAQAPEKPAGGRGAKRVAENGVAAR